MYSDILNTLKTHEDLKDLKDEMDLLSSSLYEKSGGEFDKVLDEKVRAGTSRTISDAISKSQVGKAEFIKGLVKELSQFKILKLTLAAELASKNIRKIHEWVALNVRERVVLEITKDKSLVAGVVVTYEGEYRDLSFTKVFEQKFDNSREEIMKLI